MEMENENAQVQKAWTERAEKVFESRQIDKTGVNRIDAIKETASVLWDLFDYIPVPPGNTEAGRLISLAKTELENAVMWAVKAVSRT